MDGGRNGPPPTVRVKVERGQGETWDPRQYANWGGTEGPRVEKRHRDDMEAEAWGYAPARGYGRGGQGSMSGWGGRYVRRHQGSGSGWGREGGEGEAG